MLSLAVLAKNMLIRYLSTDSDAERVERVLEKNIGDGIAVTIDVCDPKAWPKYVPALSIAAGLLSGEIQPASEKMMDLNESTMPEKWKKKRDERYAMISVLVEQHLLEIYDPATRGSLISSYCHEHGYREQTVRDLVRLFLQGGCCKNALVPRYSNCGNPGKPRPAGNRKKDGQPYKKRGRRPNIVKNKPEKVNERPELMGFNVTEEMEDKILAGGRLFLEVRKLSKPEAYRCTIHKFFTTAERQPDGTFKYKRSPEYPSQSQFEYHYERRRDFTDRLIAREGRRKYLLNYRPIPGSSTSRAFAAGSVYVIDSTVADVYLVSTLDHNLVVGRPIIYLVMDLKTHLFAGYHISLESPKYCGAMMAVLNAALPKEQVAARYGLEITRDQWPSFGLPDSIVADRGEMVQDQVDHIVNQLGINVTNLPPGRADLKGLVEQGFRLMNLSCIHSLPGAVPRERQRGERDYRKDAVLDLCDLNRLVINTIVHLNSRWLKGYPLSEGMMEAGVRPSPVDIWSYEMEHGFGALRECDQVKLRLALLPIGRGVVDRKGILFEGEHYYSEAISPWLVRAATKGSWDVQVSYEPDHSATIWVKNGSEYIPCHSTGSKGKDDRYFADIEAFDKDLDDRRRLEHEAEVDAAGAAFEFRDEVVSRAKSRQRKERAQNSGTRTSVVVKNVRENRQSEIAATHEPLAPVISPPEPPKSPEYEPKYIPPAVDYDESEDECNSDPDRKTDPTKPE